MRLNEVDNALIALTDVLSLLQEFPPDLPEELEQAGFLTTFKDSLIVVQGALIKEQIILTAKRDRMIANKRRPIAESRENQGRFTTPKPLPTLSQRIFR